jgi:hypothetical protein
MKEGVQETVMDDGWVEGRKEGAVFREELLILITEEGEAGRNLQLHTREGRRGGGGGGGEARVRGTGKRE